MTPSLSKLGIDKLTVDQRLDLIDLIWDSLAEDAGLAEATEHNVPLLESRRAEALANPGVGRPWREVLDSLGRR